MGCFTDPNRKKATDPGKVEGNPVFLYHDLINDDAKEVEDLKTRYRAGTVGDVEVKKKLIAAHQRLFGPAKEKRNIYANDHKLVDDILASGAERASKVADGVMKNVYEIVGLGE